MFRTSTILLSFIASISFLFSCEEEVFISSKDFKPKMVLNCLFTSDSIWTISLTHSVSIFDKSNSSNAVTDAIIVVTNKLGQQIGKLRHVANGLYLSDGSYIAPGSIYKVNVFSKEFGNLTATSSIPYTPEIQNIKLKSSQEVEQASEVEFNINDAGIEENFYIWSIVEIDTLQNTIQNQDKNLKIEFNALVNEIRKDAESSHISKVKDNKLVSDIDLLGSSNTTKLITRKKSIHGALTGVSDPDIPNSVVPFIRLLTVSPELYKYYQSIENYLRYSSNSSVVDQQQIFTNVDGGLGVFAGYSVKYFPIVK